MSKWEIKVFKEILTHKYIITNIKKKTVIRKSKMD